MSSNPQWKMFQPPDSHPQPLQEILDLQHSSMQAKQAYRNGTYSSEYPSSPRDNYSNMNKSSGNRFSMVNYNMDGCPMGDSGGVYSSGSTNNSSSQYDSMNHPPIRETGIIEKLLHSYGFIQCCERQARLFFHFSQFSGNIEHLKIGDPVEFEMTYDRRTGKPIASTVTKIAPEVVLSEARVTGTVTTEVKGEGSGDNTGRISYENRGECFFLPYTKDDVEGNVTLHTGDAVSFQIATNQRGTLGACHVRFENPVHPVKYHGVVCSMKENFGFIERADVVKEIFFHYSEAKVKEELTLGDDVEFTIQTRNGKEVACGITKLPSGSVVFEDVSPEIMRGQVLKPLERGNMARVPQNDPLPGRIRYRAADHSEVEVPFGEKDQSGEFTLRHGDWVQFQVATDRRDQLKRATNISLLDESFNVSGERREQGVVTSLRDGFGFIRCVEREQTMFFHFAEVLRLGHELSVGDEVEFTVDPVNTFSNMNTRQSAIRIKHLPPGTVQFETLVERGARGVITKEAQLFTSTSSPTRTAPPSFVHEGGLVPKSLYVAGAFTERDGDPLSEDSVYRCVSLGKGQVHEVIVLNRDPQSVLTWDFDVLRHDISFAVYRTEHELRMGTNDNNSALCVGGSGGEEKSVLEQRGWQEGEHYHRVESALVCHDGESIQGSHVMMECGSYILQWRCELLDSAHRAAQLVYFHETLASHHYKGSMSSLQSGTSGFSCLSGKSAVSSCPSR